MIAPNRIISEPIQLFEVKTFWTKEKYQVYALSLSKDSRDHEYLAVLCVPGMPFSHRDCWALYICGSVSPSWSSAFSFSSNNKGNSVVVDRASKQYQND